MFTLSRELLGQASIRILEVYFGIISTAISLVREYASLDGIDLDQLRPKVRLAEDELLVISHALYGALPLRL